MLKLLAAMAVSVMTLAPQQWIWIASGGTPGDRGAFLVERSSIADAGGGHSKAQMYLISYEFAALSTMEFDCPGKRYRSLGSKVMTANGPEEYGAEDWDAAPGDSNIGKVLIYVCSGGVTLPEGADDLGSDDPVETVRTRMRALD